MNSYLGNPLFFLVDTLFSLYILAVMLRFLLQWSRADFFNPISQFLVRITQPPLKPLRRVIPGIGGIDVSSVVLMIALQIVALVLLSLIAGARVNLPHIVLLAPVELLSTLFNVYIFSIIIQAVLSWVVQPGQYHPAQTLLFSLTEPILRPFRQVVPPISGIDLSPLVAIIILQVLKMLVVSPLQGLAA